MGAVSVWEDERVLAMDGGCGFTTLNVLTATELCI